MVTFDAPIVACEVCGEYVVRDQSVAACAREHDCGDRICPMRDCFPVDVEPADVEKTPK